MPSIEIDSPEDQDTVSSNFTVAGILDIAAARNVDKPDPPGGGGPINLGPFVRCRVVYSDDSQYPAVPGVIAATPQWQFPMAGVPATSGPLATLYAELVPTTDPDDDPIASDSVQITVTN